MITSYQVILIGNKNVLINEILDILFKHTKELGVSESSIKIIYANNFYSDYLANSPTFCVYFGNNTGQFRDLTILKRLVKDATLILPVVQDLKAFRKSIPSTLYNINGFELSSASVIESLVSSILEGLGLLRLSRRLFISYKRNESTSVAIQLFEQFEKNGFDVFLDTHSIRPGEPFQDELWQRLADTDIVVMLNTPGFLNSNWTKQELAQANAMSIGILQLVWPGHKPEDEAGLSIPLYLKNSDFNNNVFFDFTSYLSQPIIKEIVSLTESLRARSLAARQDNMITEFISSAIKFGVKTDLQSEKFITVKKSNGNEVIVIPTVGVPQAFTYNQSEELVTKIKSSKVEKVYLLFDHRNIRDRWLNHLSWLDNYLPIKTIKIVEVEQWLTKI